MLLFLRKHILQISASVVVALGLLLPAPLAAALAYGEGSYNNCNYNTTNCSSPSPGGGGSSGSASTPSSSSSSSSTPSAGDILLNDHSEYFTDSGYSTDLSPSQVIYFNVDVNGVSQKHKLTVKAVNSDNITFVFDDNANILQLNVGQSGQYDVIGDGVNDIAVTLNSITDGKANVTFKQLGNATKKPAAAATSSPANTEPAKRNWMPIIGFSFIFLLGLVWFIWLLARRRHKERLNTF